MNIVSKDSRQKLLAQFLDLLEILLRDEIALAERADKVGVIRRSPPRIEHVGNGQEVAIP